MTIEEGKEWLIEHCQEMFEENVSGSVFTVLPTIMQAEDEGLIKRNWRQQLDVDNLIAFLKNNQTEVEKEWQREYQQLKRITDYGGTMIYEEMMLILGLRSDLESGLRFVSNKPAKILADLDEDLKEVLRINLSEVRDCRNAARRNSGALSSYLSNHWWWRYDEEN